MNTWASISAKVARISGVFAAQWGVSDRLERKPVCSTDSILVYIDLVYSINSLESRTCLKIW